MPARLWGRARPARRNGRAGPARAPHSWRRDDAKVMAHALRSDPAAANGRDGYHVAATAGTSSQALAQYRTHHDRQDPRASAAHANVAAPPRGAPEAVEVAGSHRAGIASSPNPRVFAAEGTVGVAACGDRSAESHHTTSGYPPSRPSRSCAPPARPTPRYSTGSLRGTILRKAAGNFPFRLRAGAAGARGAQGEGTTA